MKFEPRVPADQVFRDYVDMSHVAASYPSAPEIEVGERCARKGCMTGAKTKSKGVEICTDCGKAWRGKACAFFDGMVGARPKAAEDRLIAKLESWREVKALVEPIPAHSDRWFWHLCLTTTFAYVDNKIGTVDNVVEWGRTYQPFVQWTSKFVRDSISLAREEVQSRQRGLTGSGAGVWLGPVEGALLLGFKDPSNAGRKRALRMLQAGRVPLAENRSAGGARERLMAPISSWLSCVEYAS